MLSIVHAAEAQFRFDTEKRQREQAVLRAIDERRPTNDAEILRTAAAPHPLPTGTRPLMTTTRPLPTAERRATASWPRPIHAHTYVRHEPFSRTAAG